MDFRQIEAFVNVVKHRSFSKAADATYLTQPTISAHIQTLEKELQMQLIDRSRKEALPTAEGRLFYDYALIMLNTREQAVYSLQNFRLNINGVVEIQASSIPGEYLVPDLMAAFKREYPAVRFYMEQSDSQSAAENLLARRGELGFTGMKRDDGLIYEPLMKDKAVLIAPDNEKFRKKQGKTLPLVEFAREPFLLREEGSATRKNFEVKLEERGIPSGALTVAAKMNSMEAIKRAVAGGIGVSIISELAAERQREDRDYLIFDLADYDSDREFYLVSNRNITMSPTAETFKLFVLDQFGSSSEKK